MLSGIVIGIILICVANVVGEIFNGEEKNE